MRIRSAAMASENDAEFSHCDANMNKQLWDYRGLGRTATLWNSAKFGRTELVQEVSICVGRDTSRTTNA